MFIFSKLDGEENGVKTFEQGKESFFELSLLSQGRKRSGSVSYR